MKKEKDMEDRQVRIQQRFSAVMYVLILAVLCYPWIMLGEHRYNLISFALCLKAEGAESIVLRAGLTADPSYAGALYFSLCAYGVYALLCIAYLITVFFKKDWNVNVAALLMTFLFIYMDMCEYMIWTVCSNVTEAILYPSFLLVLSGIECIGRKIIEIWDRETEARTAYEKKEKEEKEEYRRRLYFPGKYNRLFYHVIWKNFIGNLKDYTVLLICNGSVFAFIVAGFGMQTLMKAGDLSYKTGYPAGAGKILFRGLVELGMVGIFMLVLLLLYYLRKRLPEYGMFKTLGIRTKTMYLCMGAELGIGAVVSIITGGTAGVILVDLFQKSAGGSAGSWVSPVLFLKAATVMMIIYLVTFFVTHDLFVGLRMGSSTDLQMIKERIPKRFHIVFILAGVLLISWYLPEYSKSVKGEDVQILVVCFEGLYLILRFGISGYLIHRKKRKGALSKLLKQHPFYHRSRSAVWYIFGLCVLQTCMISLFSVQLFSAQLVTDTDSLFPYDLVLIAGEGEEEDIFLKELSEREGVTYAEYPMVRVSGCETEIAGIASQNIGISESTYHALKKALYPDYQEKVLGLDDNGEKIYIVHQQDKGTEAQPVDHYDTYVPVETPVLYTGPVCEGYSPDKFPAEFSHSLTVTSFYIRQIAGEETDSLIGGLCQGERDNLIVFSDTYFEKAVDEWKVTNPYTGWIMTPEEFEEEGLEPRQGPTRLVLVNAGEKVLKELEPELQAFGERHRQEEKYDTKVRNSYLKTEIRLREETELKMRITMARLLIAAFFAASVLLLGIKMLTEKKVNVRKEEFLDCMGMKRKERMALLRSEMWVYYVLTVLVSGALSACIVHGTVKARLYEAADVSALLQRLVPFAVCEMIVFGIIMWLLTEYYIRQIMKAARE